MLKVKKKNYSHTDQTRKDIAKLQSEIKQSIQKLEHDDKNKAKTINEYSQLIQKIRK